MKHLFILFTFITISIHAQDTIRFRNGESKAVKVSEVGLTDIHYSRFDNLEGPKYIVNKNDIRFIKYAGGQIDSFAITKPKEEAVVSAGGGEKPKEVKKRPTYDCPKLVIQGKDLFCNGRPVGESRLLKMIPNVEDNMKRNKLLRAYQEMKVHKKKQYLFGFIGLGVGVGAAYLGFVGTIISEDAAPLLVGVALGVGVGVTGAVVATIHKKKRTEKKLEIARIYNE